MKLIPQKLEGLAYCTAKIARSWLQPFLTDPPMWQRQMDGKQHMARSAYMLSRVKNHLRSVNFCLSYPKNKQGAFLLPHNVHQLSKNRSWRVWSAPWGHCSSTIDWLIDWLIEQGLTSPPTQYRLYGRRFFTGHKTQPTVSKYWRNTEITKLTEKNTIMTQ